MEEDSDMPLDTIKITTQTLTLDGFKVWKTLPVEQVCSAAENYSFAAQDLCHSVSDRPKGPASCECARLLQYYSNGFKQALSNAPKATRSELLDGFIKTINIALLATGIDLPPFPGPQKEFQIPNGSVTELLIKSRYESLSLREKSRSLDKFKKMIRGLRIFTVNNARERGAPTSTWYGLPFTLFACVSHVDAAGTPLCVVGTSIDRWSREFSKVSRVWRQRRFPEGNPATAQLRLDGARIGAGFESVKPETLIDVDVNRLNNAMFTEARYPAPLPQQFGFLCSQEVGRPFAGRPLFNKPDQEDREMYQEMCRCWKCRYMHHYNVNAESGLGGPIERESPTQTSIHCNAPLYCAEDLVQIQCAGLRSQQGQQAIPRQDNLDISNPVIPNN